MAGYFDNSDGTLKIIEYTWADINTNGETWADLTSWQEGSDAYGFQPIDDVADIEYFTAVLDLGRRDWVNPLCSVDAAGDVNIKVFASETATSDTIPGDPVINGQTGQTFDAVYGRYFQFKVEVFSNSAEEAQLNRVETNLSTAKQTEFFSEDSTNHNGTTDMRYPTLVNEYSKILLVNGAARLLDNADSTLTYTTVIDDVGPNNITITETGSPTSVTDVFKFEPASIRINDDDGTQILDTNDSLSIPLSTYITTGQFEISGWMRLQAMEWLDGISSPPNLAHSEYFLHLDTGGTDLYLKTSTEDGLPGLSYSTNGTTWTLVGTPESALFGGGPEAWFYWGIARKSSGTTRIWISSPNKISFEDITYSQSLSGATLKLGDLGTTTVGEYWFDDVAVYDADQNFIGAPGAAKIVNSSTVFLMNGATEQVPTNSNIPIVTVGALTERTQARYAVYRASGQATDAFVSLQVTGLPKLSSDAAGNLVQGG